MESTFERSRSGLYIPKKLGKLLSNFYAFRRLGDPLFNRLGMRGLPWGFGSRIGGLSAYVRKVIAIGPIAYWILGESAGAVAVDQINSPAQDGTYTGVTLGQPGIGDGNTAPFFDGINDNVDVISAALAAAFDGDEFSISCWAQVFNVGVWTDGNFRNFFELRVDANNRAEIRKTAAANTVQFTVVGGAGVETHTQAGLVSTDYIHFGMTRSLSAGATGEVIYYIDRVQVGATDVGLIAWVGAIVGAMIGDRVATGLVWHGQMAHFVVFDRAVTPAEMLDLGTV